MLIADVTSLCDSGSGGRLSLRWERIFLVIVGHVFVFNTAGSDRHCVLRLLSSGVRFINITNILIPFAFK